LLARIGRLLADTPCRHCGRPPYELSLADADMDRVDDEERWLWRRLADAEKVRASAPARHHPARRHGAAPPLARGQRRRVLGLPVSGPDTPKARHPGRSFGLRRKR